MIQEGTERLDHLSMPREETDHEQKSNQLSKGNERVYFMNLICSPKILQDPHNKNQRFSGELWSDKQIKSIRQMTHYVQILINHKREKRRNPNLLPAPKKQLITQYNLTDLEYQRELQTIKKQFIIDYPLFKKLVEQRRTDQEKMFQQWVRSMKGKNFIGWFMPLRDQGSKLRKLVISKLALKMLGYEPEEFNFQFQKYTDIAVDLMNGQTYKASFLSYFNSFQNYMSAQLRNALTLEQCVKKSNFILMNDMIGKNHLQVKVQMKFCMPNPYTVCYQMIRVMQQNEYQREHINEYKNTLKSKVEKTAFHSLSRITKLPRQMNPQNTNKICTYQIIREPEIWQCNSNQVPSESEYLLSDQK